MLINPDVIGRRFYHVFPEVTPRRMIMPVKVSAGPLYSECMEWKSITVPALIDTGAYASAIDQSIVEELRLVHVGNEVYATASGEIDSKLYYVDLTLFDDLIIKMVNVPGCILTGDVRMLIGMDVLGLGEFAHIKIPDAGSALVFRIPDDVPFLADQK